MGRSRKVRNSKPVATVEGNKGSRTNAQARGVLQLIRQQLRAYASVPSVKLERAPATRKRAALVAGDLPADLRRLQEKYQQEHPEFHLEPVRFMTVGVPGEVGTTFTTADLPSEEELVVLVLSETVVSAAQLDVRSQMLLARRRPAD